MKILLVINKKGDQWQVHIITFTNGVMSVEHHYGTKREIRRHMRGYSKKSRQVVSYHPHLNDDLSGLYIRNQEDEKEREDNK